MDDILKTTLLESNKSTFIIDLIRHDSGKQYIRILQSIHDEKTSNERAIKINPSVLGELIKVLGSYQELLPHEKEEQMITDFADAKKSSGKTLSESEKTAIQKRYLKGISIKALTIQFNCKAELIEQVLRNANIAIVDYNPSKTIYGKKFKRKRK